MPQHEVQFMSGLKAAYTAIQEKNPYCFYLCTDTNELYIGEELLTNADALAAAISRIAANEGAISSLQSAVNTLNGDASTEGSVLKIVADAIDAVVDGAPDTFDTFKEIADYLSESGQEAAQIISDLSDLKDLVGELPAGAESTNVVDYISEYHEANEYSPFNVDNPEDVLIVPENAYSGSRSVTSLSFPHALVVEKKAFWDAETLQTVSLPLAKTIGESAFESCIALQAIDLPQATYVGKNSYAMVMFATSLNAPLLKVVGYGCFQNTMIDKIDLPSVEIIEDVGFGGSFYATEINIPMVQVIGDSAFQNAELVETLTLNEVKSIGSLCFYDCAKLKDIYITTDWVPEAGHDIFMNTPMDTADSVTGEIEGKIYVQGRLVDKFKEAEGWSTYENCIVAIPGTEISAELPSTSIADAGKVLKVDASGNWAKGEDNSTIYWKSF